MTGPPAKRTVVPPCELTPGIWVSRSRLLTFLRFSLSTDTPTLSNLSLSFFVDCDASLASRDSRSKNLDAESSAALVSPNWSARRFALSALSCKLGSSHAIACTSDA